MERFMDAVALCCPTPAGPFRGAWMLWLWVSCSCWTDACSSHAIGTERLNQREIASWDQRRRQGT